MGYGRTYVTHQEGLITEGRCVGANCACAFLSAQPLIKHELSQRSGWCRNRLAKGWGFWKPHREGRKRRKRRKGEGERRYRAPFCLLPYENTARLSRTTKLTLPDTECACTLVLDFPSLQKCKKEFSFDFRSPSLWHSVIASRNGGRQAL